MPLEWNSISQSAMNHRTMISIAILVELRLPLLSEKICLSSNMIFCSVCMMIFLKGKNVGKEIRSTVEMRKDLRLPVVKIDECRLTG